MNIAIIGWYGERNAGDDMFQEVFKQELGKHTLYFCQRVDKLSVKPDVVIFGGGGVLSAGNYFAGLNKTQPLYALGVDLATHEKDYENWISYNFKELYTRSQEYAWELQKKWTKVRYCPDLAFGVAPPEPLANDPVTRRLVVNLTNELLKYPDAQKQIVQTLSDLSAGWELHFVGFYCGGKNPDSLLHQQVAAQLPKTAKVVFKDDYVSPHDVMQYMSMGDAVMCMRFHGVIFSTIMGIPFVVTSPLGKNSLYCAQEGLDSQFLPMSTLKADDLKVAILAAAADTSLPQRLRQIQVSNMKLVLDQFAYVRETWLSASALPS